MSSIHAVSTPNSAVVTSFLDQGEGEEALQEALKGHSFFHSKNDKGLRRVAEFHLKQDNLPQAKKVAQYMCGEELDKTYVSIFKAELARGDLEGAEKTADSIFGRNWAFTKIFQKKLDRKDFQGALLAALKTSALRMAELLQELFNVCLENKEYEIARQVAENMNCRNQEWEDGLNKILDAELEKNDFVAAVKTSKILSTQESAQKIADRLPEANLDLKSLREIELGMRVNWLSHNLALTILHALKSAYASLNETGEVERLEDKIQFFQASKKSADSCDSMAACATLAALSMSLLSIIVGVGLRFLGPDRFLDFGDRMILSGIGGIGLTAAFSSSSQDDIL